MENTSEEKKIGKSIEERANPEIINKTKARTIAEDKWERKKYLLEFDSIKDKGCDSSKTAYVASELQLWKG